MRHLMCFKCSIKKKEENEKIEKFFLVSILNINIDFFHGNCSSLLPAPPIKKPFLI